MAAGIPAAIFIFASRGDISKGIARPPTANQSAARGFARMSFSRLASFFQLRWLTPAARRTLGVQMLVLFALSTLLNFGYYGERELRRLAEKDHVQAVLVGWDGFEWYAWLMVSPGMLLLLQRYPLTPGRIARNLARLALGSLGLYFVAANARFFLRVLPNLWLPSQSDLPADWPTYLHTTLVLLPLDFMTCAGFFAISFAVDYFFKHRRQAEEVVLIQLRASELQSDLARAELAALRGQLHPHFLFNSLNAVASLVRQKKSEAAVEIIAQLSGLLRLAIERTGLQVLSLGDELDFVRRYLAIEHVRFGDKLRLDFAIEPAALNGLVPNLVLQPIVENSVKHGISRRTQPGTVRIAVRQAEGRLLIEISDDGPDPDDVSATESIAEERTGIGLANTRARLDKLYGSDYRFELRPRAEGGTVVQLDLPWRPAPAPDLPHEKIPHPHR
jgi:signal transduction histidine kinase